MRMLIRFGKKSRLRFISHLDLQRFLHMALNRTGLPIKYSEGFNPHAKLVFGVPLSVGTESMCEMADLKIERKIGLDEIKNRLNEQLTDEMYVLEAYYPSTKYADISYADYTVTLKSPKIKSGDEKKISALFSSPIMMVKKSKSGEKEVDITDFVKRLDASAVDGCITINAILSAGSTENLNPEYLVTAIKSHLELFSSDPSKESYRIMRNRVYDRNLLEFK